MNLKLFKPLQLFDRQIKALQPLIGIVKHRLAGECDQPEECFFTGIH